MSYPDFEKEHVRLEILLILEEDADFSMPATVLAAALNARRLAPPWLELIRELHWLAEHGLVVIVAVNAGGIETFSARLTNTGEDVALGRTRMAGVARPRPGV